MSASAEAVAEKARTERRADLWPRGVRGDIVLGFPWNEIGRHAEKPNPARFVPLEDLEQINTIFQREFAEEGRPLFLDGFFATGPGHKDATRP